MKDLAVLGVVVMMVLCALRWRAAVCVALVIVVLEGAIRKWLLPSASDYVYFLKDMVLLGAYAGYFFGGRSGRTRVPVPVPLQVALVLAGAVVLAQSFNPNLGSPLVGLFGAKAYLLYMPLLFMVADLFRTPQELQRFLQRYLLLVIPVCLLGVVQFFAPIDSPLNTYVTRQDEVSIPGVAGFGEENRARITGTFSYIAGHTTYCLICVALALTLWAHTPKFKWKILYLGMLMLLVMNLFMTGSRAPVFSVAILVILFGLAALQGRSKKERKTVFALIGATIACVGASVYLSPEATDAFVYRATTAGDDTAQRATGGLLEPFDYMEDTGLLGYGAGITHPGGQAIASVLGLPGPIYAAPPTEGEPVRVMLELGVVGFFAWYTMRLCVLWMLWRTYKQLKVPWLRHLALVSFLIQAINIGGQVMLNPTLNVYYWFLSGFIFALPRLERALPASPARQRARWRAPGSPLPPARAEVPA